MEKGLTIISEALLSIGIIIVAMAFVFVGGNIVSFQSQGLFSSTQNQIASDVSSLIRNLPEGDGSISTSYSPPIDSYTLTVQNSNSITVDIPGQETSTTSFTGLSIKTTRISDSDQLCISRTGKNVSLSPGPCETDVTSGFCSGGNCVNNVCQPSMGENCGNSGGDCPCPAESSSPDASGECKPGYTAESFINAPGAGGSTPDTVDNQCVNQSFVGVQGKGERCSYNFECSSSNECVGTSSSPGHCCPPGETWDGSSCIEDMSYTIVAVPIKYNLPSQMSEYEQDAQQFEEFWERESIFRTCNSPNKAVEVKTLSSSCSNDVASACQGSFCSDSCANEIIKCASNNHPDFDKAEGFYDGPGMSVSGGTVTGCSAKASLIADDQGSTNGGAIHITGLGFESGKGIAHELGHDFGLCHGKSDSSWSNPSVKPCDPSIDSSCIPACIDSDHDGSKECTYSGTSCTGNDDTCSTDRGKCIGCDSSYCPNDDPQDPADVMNYQTMSPPSKYKFLSQEDSHIASFTKVKKVLNKCK